MLSLSLSLWNWENWKRLRKTVREEGVERDKGGREWRGRSRKFGDRESRFGTREKKMREWRYIPNNIKWGFTMALAETWNDDIAMPACTVARWIEKTALPELLSKLRY